MLSLVVAEAGRVAAVSAAGGVACPATPPHAACCSGQAAVVLGVRQVAVGYEGGQLAAAAGTQTLRCASAVVVFYAV